MTGIGSRSVLLAIADAVFAALLVTPAVVAYWRATWLLTDVYAWPPDDLISAIESTVLGVIGHLVFALGQPYFARLPHPSVAFYVCSRLYTICFAFVCVNGWRGPWSLMDLYDPPASLIFLFGIVMLALLRALRNVSAPPCALATDHAEGYFLVLTMFRVSLAQNTFLYILDCLFSVLVVGTLVVFVWRGAWVLLDIYLFPEDEILSAWASLAVGYMIVAIAFLLQPLMRWVCDRLGAISRLLVADIFLLFSLAGTVNVWRGIWNLLNIYFLPDNVELSCWITHWLSLAILILLGCSNSLLVRGVYIDAEEPDGKCVIFPCHYLRLIFRNKKTDKGTNGVQLVSAAYTTDNRQMTVLQMERSNHI